MVVNISLTKLDLLQIKTSRNENFFFFFFTFHPFFSNYECCGKRREYYIVTWKTINGISKENYKITHNSQWHGCSIAMVGWQRVPTLSPRVPPPARLCILWRFSYISFPSLHILTTPTSNSLLFLLLSFFG